jgi:hypothetical protein
VAFLCDTEPRSAARPASSPTQRKLSERITGPLVAEPEATPERRDQIILQTLKEQRAAGRI